MIIYDSKKRNVHGNSKKKKNPVYIHGLNAKAMVLVLDFQTDVKEQVRVTEGDLTMGIPGQPRTHTYTPIPTRARNNRFSYDNYRDFLICCIINDVNLIKQFNCYYFIDQKKKKYLKSDFSQLLVIDFVLTYKTSRSFAISIQKKKIKLKYTGGSTCKPILFRLCITFKSGWGYLFLL